MAVQTQVGPVQILQSLLRWMILILGEVHQEESSNWSVMQVAIDKAGLEGLSGHCNLLLFSKMLLNCTLLGIFVEKYPHSCVWQP